MHPFLIALQFLSCIPVRLRRAPQPAELGRSLLWYPAVGLLIGLLLWLVAAALAFTTPLLRAAILLGVWVAITGALHLDGLADCADAWIGARGDRERTLAIMKDPYAGPVAVAVVVVVLLIKFAALDAVLAEGRGAVLLLAPMLARAALPALFLTTPYVRARGLGSELAAQIPRVASRALLVAVSLASILALRWQGLLALIIAGGVFALLRAGFMRSLQGFTGDCAGALTELIEASVLVSLALSSATPV